jgi:ribonuclease T2
MPHSKRWLLLLLLSFASLSPALVRAQGVVQGWVLTLSWSPEYCKKTPGSKEPQCQDENYFVPHGLSPLAAGALADDCPEVTPLAPEELNRLLLTVPNRGEVTRRWRREGGCTGLAPADFAMQLDTAARAVTVPQRYALVWSNQETTASALKAAFMQSNRGLTDQGIALQCQRGWLRNVQVCFDAATKFATCSALLEDKCPASIKIRGIPRERVVPE